MMWEIGEVTENKYWYENTNNGKGGELIIENGKLIDFDGMFALPKEVADLLIKRGIEVNKKLFCLEEESK